ncbi:branched-chain amino acid ABC transporter permease [Oceanidesulfovibrio marinus]|uniref:Branched-chain amino acid ABC transporter permease n=1 Tax=Oceanidesulfovibrio marinus TaxID=370038 RepID=A0A6P1ZHK7_9BACT|nr:branched-chain amino acid ABC transporter permease [Oceanidesulfovibrio marinus]QJT08457.1 branched-chain amino acid ABC transporter permease [Oceanidesulfovibrio marinus]TVM33077.1 branched-chain amino acid ABC transporter permease [Oceanidesulfovibrio marinus]
MNKKIALPLLAVACILPFMPFTSEYMLHVFTLVMVYMVLAMGLNIVPGFCGLLDLGFVGFYGIGAYTAGLLTINYGLSFWVIVPFAALNGALWGILLGAPTLRLTGDYFAIVTFGFSELVVLFLTNEIWLTRGPLGLPGIDPVSIDLSFISKALNPAWDWYYEFDGELPYFFLALVMVLVIYGVMRRLEDSRLGRAWYAIREDPLAASSCGVNILNYKVIAFAISAGIGAVGGCFFARWTLFLSPDMFKFWESFLVLCMVVLGGLGNINGALIGAAVLVALGEVLRVVLPELGLPVETRFLFYGLIMILIMRFKPSGFLPRIAATGMQNPIIQDLKKRLDRERAAA